MLVLERLGLKHGELAGQVAVITGAGQGIGREAALALGALGARVVVADTNGETGQETAALIRTAGGTATFVATDVASEADVARLAMWTLADFGPADILINNAIISPVASLMEMAPDLWDRVIAVNLRGAYLTCRAFVPGMLAKGQGTIINMVSAEAMANMSAYIASKQGLTGFSQSLAAELGHEGIRVIAFADMMPAADAGAATAYLAARLASEYSGEVVTGYTVLERAGFLPPAQTAAATQAASPNALRHAVPPARALELSRPLQDLIADIEADLGRLPVFVRPLARSGFKSKAGLSLSTWSWTAAELTGALESGRPVPADLLRLLGRLLGYCQGVPDETARFTHDEVFLAQVRALSQQRSAVIEELIAALGGLVGQ